MSNFHETSYTVQRKHIEKKLENQGIDEFLFSIKNKDCVSTQLSLQSLKILKPFFVKDERWLTIGDYYGLEAAYLKENGTIATASDISDAIISKVHELNYIYDYKAINVENIDYADNSFDYVFCREAFHHFPRAYLGLYEMIRVADKAAIIIEPIDILAKMPVLLFVKNILDRINPLLINKFWKNRFSFEFIGNYVFKISEREVEKIAMGIGLPCIAFKPINGDFSHVSNPTHKEIPLNKKAWNKVMRKLKFLDFLNFLTLIPKNSLCCVVFKQAPNKELISKLKKEGYTIIELPKNPYIKE